jgi:hypothetical protein
VKSSERAGIVKAMQRFAEERDTLFEQARDDAKARLAKEFNIESYFANPDKYLGLLFVKIGTEIVKGMFPMARRIGKENANRLFSA